MGEMVDVPAGDGSVPVYSSSGGGPAVVVGHEFFGLTPFFKGWVDRLGAAGFTAVAPDFYHGEVAGSVDEAKAKVRELEDERVGREVRAAAAYARERAGEAKLGAIGFSLGAGTVGELIGDDLSALVLVYGLPWREAETIPPIPFQGHFADVDEWEDLGEARLLFDQMSKRGAETEIHIYPGLGHWFANEDVPDAYDAAASALVWDRSLGFFNRNLS
jgi:carboxymethylenebutenolidase